MKKILISLAIIGVVAGITLGITGAFWTDQGVSENQSFVSGSLNLRLSNNGSNWSDNVTQTWNVSKMAPGGTPYVSTLYMKNNGSVNADYLKFTLVNTPSPAGMDKVMRITELSYAGKSLLTGGAGADLDGYVAPTNCDISVHPGTYQKITDAISNASANDVICVGPGNYSTGWEGGVVDVNKGVTIASTDGPGNTTISTAIQVSVDNVTIKGFKIIAGPISGSTAGVYVPSVNGLTVEYNEIDGQSVAGSRGIEFFYNGVYNNILIENNVIHDLGTGIYPNPHTGTIVIVHNDFSDNEAGIGGTTGATIRYNKFSGNEEAIGLDSSACSNKPVINYNNIEGDKINAYSAWPTYGSIGCSINAKNNWWGDFNPSDQINGSTINYTPYAGGPFIGYVNGNDYYKNGFADLDDFEHEIVIVENPDLKPNSATYHTLKMGVQLDGPTTSNHYMGGTVGMNMTVTMGQGPAQ